MRTAVLDATIGEVIDRGLDQLTVAAVAARTGVHETSIYRRWRSREDLIVDALLERSATQIPAPDTGSIRGDLVEIARLVTTYLTTPLGRAVAQTATLHIQDDELAQARSAFFAARVDAMRVVIDRAVDRGELRPDTDAALTLEVLVAPLHMRTLLTGRPLPDDLPEVLADVVVDGLRSRESSPAN